MNSRDSKILQRGISRRYTSRFFLYLVCFSLIYTGFFLLVYLLGNSVIWYADNLLYGLLSVLNSNPLPVFFMGWIVGAIVIVIFQWRRTAKDIVALSYAIAALTRHPENQVELPTALSEMEMYMQEIQLENMRNRQLASEAEQRKNDLVVYLAHDLKTPLTSVMGYLTLLCDEPDIPAATQKKYIRIATGKAQRLQDLIDEFFEITRFNLKGLELEKSRLNFSRMLEQVVNEFDPLFTPKNLTCTTSIAPALELMGDPGKLERVVDNLLRNAVNYSHKNTEIRLDAWQAEGWVSLRVTNRGDTIPEYKLSRIFEQFYRVDEARGANQGGSGLGLAIAKEIVQLHGGDIQAQSQDEIIEFTVCLPAAPAPLSQASQPMAAIPPLSDTPS